MESLGDTTLWEGVLLPLFSYDAQSASQHVDCHKCQVRVSSLNLHRSGSPTHSFLSRIGRTFVRGRPIAAHAPDDPRMTSKFRGKKTVNIMAFRWGVNLHFHTKASLS